MTHLTVYTDGANNHPMVQIVMLSIGMSDEKRKSDEIDYTAEGSTPAEEPAPSDTDRGYDEAVRSGESRYGTPEGHGGVFGTTGGGTFGGGMQVVERPVVYEHDETPEKKRPNKS